MLLNEFEVREFLGSIKENHYVYGLCYQNGTPFYIGKGSGDRIFHHIRNAKNLERIPYNPFKIRVIQKILSNNEDIKYRIFGVYDTTEIAENIEEKLIIYYGRRNSGDGPLTNITIGKDGHTKWSKKSRATISEVMRTLHQNDPTLRIKNGIAVKKAIENNPEIRIRMSESAKKRFSDPEERLKQSKRIKQSYINDPKLKERQLRSLKRRLKEDPLIIEKYRQNSIELYKNRPEVKKKISETLKSTYQNNPEIQQKKGNSRRKNNQKKRLVRSGCLDLIKKHNLDITLPNGYQGINTFQEFEKHLLNITKQN